MSRTGLYLSIVIAVTAASLGGYYVVTQMDVVHFPAVSAPAPTDQTSATAGNSVPRPNHGDFEKRFEPRPPASKSDGQR